MRRDSDAAGEGESRVIAGRYALEELLGTGGMSSVYAVTDRASGKRIALKCMYNSASETALALFKREFHTLAGLRHPNIIEVYDFGCDAECSYYTMELLRGADLGRAAPLPWREVCRYLRQVATLLGLLHARRLLHRDLTPRNLWVQPDGQLKLIDFGALCPFGTRTEIVGTPPFVAPEWFDDQATGQIDQRSDLYGLGALGYWLLTNSHAYPAQTLHDLPRAWLEEPAPPSRVRALDGEAESDPIPPELDALILALLRHEAKARPETTEVLVDRLDAVLGTSVEVVDPAVGGYVRSKAFVGRAAELAQIKQRLHVKGQVIAVVAEQGLGRSRLLEEVSLLARLSGRACVLVRAHQVPSAYSLANALCLALFALLPSEARAAAAPYAAQLAQLSHELCAKLGRSERPARDNSPRGRERLQAALTAWVSALCDRRELVLVIDDLDRCDEESSAWLAALAVPNPAPRPVLIASLTREPNIQPVLHLRMFEQAALRVELQPLEPNEVHELAGSVFGAAPYLARVAEQLYRASRGNPAHCLELIEHLVNQRIARHAQGTWSLPGELPEALLPRSRSEMHFARLARVSSSARELAELLCIHDGPLSRANCYALSQATRAATDSALSELTQNAVLRESDGTCTFTHATVRERLATVLSGTARRRAHARLAASLLAEAADPIDAMCAGLHWFDAGDTSRCQRLVHEAAMHIFAGHRGRLRDAVPMFERALVLFRRAELPAARHASTLAALATAAYFVDRRLADRYGHAALAALENMLRFDLVRKLRGRVGAKPAFFSALAVAAATRHKTDPTVAEALRMLFGCAIALNAVATAVYDTKTTQRCKEALEPFAVLSDREVAGFVRRCVLSVGSMLTADHAATLNELNALRSLMESGAPIRNLPDHLRGEFLGGCMLSIGVMESWRQSPTTLEIADRIEPISPVFALDADHLRAVYYEGRGDMLRAEHYRQRLEMRGLQLGAIWQVVTLGPLDMSLIALFTQDPLTAKRSWIELERLSQEIPSFSLEARRARAAYLVLSGRYRETIELMQYEPVVPDGAGWSRAQSLLARAHNRLGEYARARELCAAALEGRSDANKAFLTMFLHVQLELALAEAGLGHFQTAHALLDELESRIGPNAAPLTLGALHEMYVRVALLERDFEAATAHVTAMRLCYAPTPVASLIEHTDQLAELVAQAVQPHTDTTHVLGTSDDIDETAEAATQELELHTRIGLKAR